MQSPSGRSPLSESTAAQSESNFRHLFNLSLDLLCVAGIDGYFKQVNPSWTRVLGWTEEELLSRPVAQFMHPEDRERTLQARAGLAKGTPVRGLENRYLCKDGSYRWLSWQSSVEETGNTVFAIARDVTERRRLDDERLMMSKLESTAILACGIAHDFNNLLGGLLLNLEMVTVTGPTNPEQGEYLRNAHDSIQTAKLLTQKLIAATEGGRASERRSIDLRNVLQQSMDLTLAGRGISGVCSIAPDLWPAEVDEAKVGQAIRNLLMNALDATSAGGHVHLEATNVVLESTSEPTLRPGNYVRIVVKDTGCGIAADILPRVFDPYFSTKQRGMQKGMGLGLTISRTVFRMHGGNIMIDSRPRAGTTVTCHLPAVPT